jgi:hypothetical protein
MMIARALKRLLYRRGVRFDDGPPVAESEDEDEDEDELDSE